MGEVLEGRFPLQNKKNLKNSGFKLDGVTLPFNPDLNLDAKAEGLLELIRQSNMNYFDLDEGHDCEHYSYQEEIDSRVYAMLFQKFYVNEMDNSKQSSDTLDVQLAIDVQLAKSLLLYNFTMNRNVLIGRLRDFRYSRQGHSSNKSSNLIIWAEADIDYIKL